MRISDWSSDVCSSDLYADTVQGFAVRRVPGGLDLAAVLAQLATRGISEVQVEAGPRLCGALLREGLVDELLLYIAPVILGDQGQPLLTGIHPATMAERLNLALLESRQIGPDLRRSEEQQSELQSLMR